MVKKLKIITLLAVYLAWVCGYAVDVFTCDCHHNATHVECSCCHSHNNDHNHKACTSCSHESIDGKGCCCHHELPTETEFYDSSTRLTLAYSISAHCIVLSHNDIPLPYRPDGDILYERHTVPLPDSHLRTVQLLRAPPHL